MTRARWTTARAVSGGADLRSRRVSPILSPEKERSGRVAALQEMESEGRRGFGVNEWNLVRGLWERKIEEEEENEREVAVGVGVVRDDIVFLGVWEPSFSALVVQCSLPSILSAKMMGVMVTGKW